MIKLKFYFLIVFALCCFTISAQKQNTDKSNFQIILFIKANKIILECNNDCDWKELIYENNLTQGINNSGMSENTSEGNFYFTIEKTKKGVTLKSEKGTNWKELSFTVKKNKKYEIDKSGMHEL